MKNCHRKLIWHTLRGLGTNGSKNHAETCKAILELIPWYSLNPHTKSDEMMVDAVRAIAANTIKAYHVFNDKWDSVYMLYGANNLLTAHFFIAAWASRETLDKYLVKDEK